MADALSKEDWDRAWQLMPEKNIDPDFIPLTLRRWINNPVPDLELGLKVLAKMKKYTSVLYVD